MNTKVMLALLLRLVYTVLANPVVSEVLGKN